MDPNDSSSRWNRKLYGPAAWKPYFEYARFTVIGRLLKIIDAADANEMGPTFERGFVDDLWDRVDGGNPLTPKQEDAVDNIYRAFFRGGRPKWRRYRRHD